MLGEYPIRQKPDTVSYKKFPMMNEKGEMEIQKFNFVRFACQGAAERSLIRC